MSRDTSKPIAPPLYFYTCLVRTPAPHATSQATHLGYPTVAGTDTNTSEREVKIAPFLTSVANFPMIDGKLYPPRTFLCPPGIVPGGAVWKWWAMAVGEVCHEHTTVQAFQGHVLKEMVDPEYLWLVSANKQSRVYLCEEDECKEKWLLANHELQCLQRSEGAFSNLGLKTAAELYPNGLMELASLPQELQVACHPSALLLGLMPSTLKYPIVDISILLRPKLLAAENPKGQVQLLVEAASHLKDVSPGKMLPVPCGEQGGKWVKRNGVGTQVNAKRVGKTSDIWALRHTEICKISLMYHNHNRAHPYHQLLNRRQPIWLEIVFTNLLGNKNWNRVGL
ncbi:hypothetical protein M427DRAFT_41713 [Gonapodya prolifera JEL478]|uniref:Uncharacterized protein n=1 Tax=Gonapodya prolifera (strain JEL478) TaxID=1344416 RepID=A0A139ATT8_GONPJ|nr:hypothetical protein M427DRAFT_41713 [Gonapodya prolifera JEL478]|eukprot:KXS19915.1 hypothetical protein M427DRAFT_41713 [Gonapodya prolifera JEL478]